MSIWSRPLERGASRSSRRLRAGCGGRGGIRRESATTSDVVADGEDAWSWRPDTGAKSAEAIPPMTGARKPGPRGERDISRKTIAWGMPDVSGASAVNTRVHTHYPTAHTRLRVHWAPGIPRALYCERAGNSRSNLARTCGEIAKLCLPMTLLEIDSVGWAEGASAPCPPSIGSLILEWWARFLLRSSSF